MSLQVQEEGNAIVVPIEIKLDKLEQLREIIQELRSTASEIPIEASDPAASAQDFNKQFETAFKEKFGEIRTPTGASDVRQLMDNPVQFMIGLFSNPYVAAALVAVGFGKVMLDFLMLPGGPLDRFFKRKIHMESNAALRVHEKQQTRTGLGRQVIITSATGRAGVEHAFNSYEARRTGEIDSIEFFQIRRGYRF